MIKYTKEPLMIEKNRKCFNCLQHKYQKYAETKKRARLNSFKSTTNIMINILKLGKNFKN